MTFCMCLSLYNGYKHCVEFYVEFCRTMPYLSLHSDIVHVGVVLGVAS